MMSKHRARFIRQSMKFRHFGDKEERRAREEKKPFYINGGWQYTEERLPRPLGMCTCTLLGASTIPQSRICSFFFLSSSHLQSGFFPFHSIRRFVIRDCLLSLA